MFNKIILLAFLYIAVVSALNTSLTFKYANVKYEETNEVQILSINNGTLNYIIIKSEDDDKEGIFRLGIQHKYQAYCNQKCKIFAKPLKNTGVAAREIIRFIELFNPYGKKSLIKYLAGEDSTTGCVNNLSKIQSNDTLETVPVDGFFYTDSSSYNLIKNFNDVAIKFSALEEKTPLARSEWIKFISVFYGYETYATQVFDEIEENYDCNRLLVKNNQHLLTRMRVAWLSRVDNNQNLWIMNDSLYKTELLKDAGADVLTIRENSVDSLHKVLKKVHFVIDETETIYGDNAMEEFYKNYEYTDESSREDVNFLSKKNVLTIDGARSSTNISSWKEDYLIYPHLVLVDLIYWFHPKLPVAKYFRFEIKDNEYDNHYWFRNIATDSPIHMTSDTKCPTEIPEILTQTVCISLKGFSNDYKDYSSFDDKKTKFKNYLRIYWYFVAIGGCIVIISCMAAYYLYRRKFSARKMKGFTKNDLDYAYESENITNHQFYRLEDEDDF